MENIDKNYLDQFRLLLRKDIEDLLQKYTTKQEEKTIEWLRSKAVRKILDISPATLQNLRITGQVKYRKILGSYYYNYFDLKKLFQDEKN